MSHFGVISPPVSGHLNPFSALGRELQSRGHRVTFFGMPDVEEAITVRGLDFRAVGETDHPRGYLPETIAAIGRRHGIAALRFTIRAVAHTTTMLCRDAPPAIRRAGIDALLVDQMEPAGGAIAEYLGLPFATICNALALNRDPVAPPPFTPWRYHTAAWAVVRNRIGYTASNLMMRPILNAVSEFRSRWKLPVLKSPDESFSRLAQICQMPREFDFPRLAVPDHFHYVGPMRAPFPGAVEFPWHRLDGRPLVYASLGTLQNTRAPLFRCFADACRELDVQLVLSHGGGLSDDEASHLPGDPLVVAYAPQVELLARASATITHAGLNTVLDSLTNGVPLVAVPITYEQPAIARRVDWTRTGRVISLARLDVKRLRAALGQILSEPAYRQAASQMAVAIRRVGGVSRAADLVCAAVGERSTATDVCGCAAAAIRR